MYHKFVPAVVWGAALAEITYGNDYKEIHRINGTLSKQNDVATKFMTATWSPGAPKASCATGRPMLPLFGIVAPRAKAARIDGSWPRSMDQAVEAM